MVRAFLPKAALLLVLILLLATPVAQAADPGAHKSPAVGILPGLLGQAWELLTGVWENNGCGIDPDGRCVPEQNAKAEADNGCGIDPSGGCAH
jgi:hypothetical protein